MERMFLIGVRTFLDMAKEQLGLNALPSITTSVCSQTTDLMFTWPTLKPLMMLPLVVVCSL